MCQKLIEKMQKITTSAFDYGRKLVGIQFWEGKESKSFLEEVTPWKTKMVAQNDPLQTEKSDIES